MKNEPINLSAPHLATRAIFIWSQPKLYSDLNMDWDTLNQKRVELIHQRKATGLTPDERALLNHLTALMDERVDEIAPLPFAKLEQAEEVG